MGKKELFSERYRKKLSGEDGCFEGGYDGVLLQLEVTNLCNHACVFCPNHESSRKKCSMEFDFAVRIIRECADFLGEDKRICFHMNGEPLLYKRLPELVALAKALGYAYIFLTTNGSLLTQERLEALVDAGLDSIKFSINAGTRASYARIHGIDDFDAVIRAVRMTDALRKARNLPLRLFVSCVGTKENEGELESLNGMLASIADEVLFYYPAHAGQVQDKMKELWTDLKRYAIRSFAVRHTAPCAVLFNSINVTAEGYLATCCSSGEDLRLIVEDLKGKHVKDAWLGARMEAIRKRHKERAIANMPCDACVNGTPYRKEAMDKSLFPYVDV